MITETSTIPVDANNNTWSQSNKNDDDEVEPNLEIAVNPNDMSPGAESDIDEDGAG